MKSNNFKLLLLSSLLLATSCNNASDTSSSNTNTESSTSSEQSSESSSISQGESSSTSSVDEEQKENENIRVTMNRRIYLRDEFAKRKAMGESVLDYSEIAIYSSAIKGFKPTNSTPTITIPEGSGNLKAKLQIGKMVTYIDIQVYDTAEEAAKANPVTEEELKNANFKEATYYDAAKKKTKFDTYYDENTGKIMQAVVSTPMQYTDKEKMMRAAIYSWAANYSFIFTDGEANTLTAELDPTRKVALHEEVEHQVVKDELMNSYIHEISKFNKAGTFVFRIDTSVEDTNYTNNDNISNVSYASEMILDAEGRICYLGIVFQNDFTHVALGDLDNYYVDPYYQNNDYSTPEGVAANNNPAFLFGPNYDAADEVNKYDFEKVIPAGGYHVVNVNNKYSYTAQGDAWSNLDVIWDAVSGFSSPIKDSTSYWNREAMLEDETGFNDNVANSIIKFMNGQCATSTVKYTRSLVAYKEADTYRKFAHLYKLAVDSKDDALISKHDDVVEALKYQQVDKVAKEPVLFNYYASIASNILDEWQAALIK